MAKIKNNFLKRLVTESETYFGIWDFSELPELIVLKKNGFIVEDGVISAFPCDQCYELDNEKIEYADGKPFYKCRNAVGTGRIWLSEDQIKRWRLDLSGILSYLIQQLNIENFRDGQPNRQGEKWFLGKKGVRQIWYAPKYYNEGFILLPTQEQTIGKTNAISLEEIIEFKKDGIKIIKRRFNECCQGEKFSFDKKAGEFKIDGKVIADLSSSNILLNFFDILWRSRPRVVSYEEIKVNTPSISDVLPPTFCQNQKREIGIISSEVKNFIKPGRTKDGLKGYKLELPS